MKRMPLVLTMFLMGTASASAANLSFLPPPEMVEKILNEHPIVGAAEANLDVAKADADRLNAGPHEYQLSGYLGARTVNHQGEFTVYDLTVSRGIRIGDKAMLDAKTGSLGIEYGANAIEDAKHQTALLLMYDWMAWLEAESLAKIDAEEAQSYARERDAVRQRVARMDAAQRDADLADAAFARANAAAEVSRGVAEEAKATLQRIFTEMALLPFAPEIAAPELPALPLERWFDLIMQRSHEVRMAELEAAKQQTLVSRAEAERRPDPSVGVRTYSEYAGTETALALYFSMPIGGAGRSAAANAQSAKARAAYADLARVRREYGQRAQQDVVKTRAGLASWQEAASARDAATTALTRTRRGYDLGEFDLSELLLVSRQNYDALRIELASRAAAQRATLQLQIDGHELWILEDDEGHKS
jgi:cobalt-zinc-cadmium efflux system outer membrane protein